MTEPLAVTLRRGGAAGGKGAEGGLRARPVDRHRGKLHRRLLASLLTDVEGASHAVHPGCAAREGYRAHRKCRFGDVGRGEVRAAARRIALEMPGEAIVLTSPRR